MPQIDKQPPRDDQPVKPPQEIDEHGKWGLLVMLSFALGIPALGVIYSILTKKP